MPTGYGLADGPAVFRPMVCQTSGLLEQQFLYQQSARPTVYRPKGCYSRLTVYRPMGCQTISLQTNGLLGPHFIDQWAVRPTVYRPMGCQTISLQTNELSDHQFKDQQAVRTKGFRPTSCSINRLQTNRLITNILQTNGLSDLGCLGLLHSAQCTPLAYSYEYGVVGSSVICLSLPHTLQLSENILDLRLFVPEKGTFGAGTTNLSCFITHQF